MPTYEVQVGGSTYEIDAPDEKALSNAIRGLQSEGGVRGAAPGPERSGGFDGAVRSAARGVLGVGSYLDEANAATNAFLAPFVDPLLPDSFEKLPGKTWGERYDQALDIQRRKDREYDEDSPIASTAAKIAGGVGSGGALLKAAPALGNFLLGNGGATVPTRLVASGLAGGGTGFVQGFGAGEGGFKSRSSQALKEGAVGAGTGVAMVPLAAGAQKVANSLVRRMLGDSDDALNAMSPEARKYITNELADVDKLKLTRQSLNDLGPEAMLSDVSPDWLGVARGAAARPGTRGMVVDPLNERAGMANTRLRNEVATNLGPDPIPSQVDQSLKASQDVVGQQYTPLMQGRSPYDFAPITDALDDEIGRLRGPAQRELQNVRNMLNVYGRPDMVTNDPSVAFQTRHAIDGILKTEQNDTVIGALTEARQMIDDGLRASVPRIKEVDAQFHELARQREALGQGRPILNNGAGAMRPAELEYYLADSALPKGEMIGPSGVPLRAQQSVLGEIYRAIGTEANDLNALRKTVRGEGDWNRDKLGQFFGQERSDNVLNAIDRENVFADTSNRVTRGSDTAMAGRFTEFLDDIEKARDIPADTTLVGAGSRVARQIAKALIQGNATTNANQVADDIGRLSVAQGDVRDQIVEALLRTGERNIVDKQRGEAIKALTYGAGLAGYQSLPGLRN